MEGGKGKKVSKFHLINKQIAPLPIVTLYEHNVTSMNLNINSWAGTVLIDIWIH